MKHSLRNWHIWISIALGIPLLLVGLTTFFIAHEKALGTKEIVIPSTWLDGPMAAGKGNEALEIRSSIQIGADLWVGTKQGLYRLDGSRAALLDGTPKDEIRGMVMAGKAVLLAGKKGLWRYENGKAAKTHEADCWQIAATAVGYSAACKDAGLLISTDGVHWDAMPIEFPEEISNKSYGVPLSKIIMDIHTGKLFFGKKGEWVWIDVLGLVIVGLALTGLVMWLRSRRTRALAGAVAAGASRVDDNPAAAT